MANTFQDFVAADLAAFGFEIGADDVPTWEVARDALNAITQWADSVDDQTWEIIRWADLSEGLWRAGYFSTWPKLYDLFRANLGGTFHDTKRNITSAVERAHNRLDEQPTGLPDETGIADVVGEAP